MIMNRPTLVDLIDQASDLCQGDARLARRIGKSPTQIADLRKGRLTMTPETVALLCNVLDLSGEECQRLVCEAIILNPKNAARKEALRRAFFGYSVSGGALALLAVMSYLSAGSIDANVVIASLYTLCTVAVARKLVRRDGPGPAILARSGMAV